MLLHLVPYLINFCFSDAEEKKQNKERVIETNTHDSEETITNSSENREGRHREHERRPCHAFVSCLQYKRCKARGGVVEDEQPGRLTWVREGENK